MIKQAEIDLSYNLGRQAAMEKLSNEIPIYGYGIGGLGAGALLGAGLGAGYGAYMGDPALEAYGRSVPGVYAGEGLVYGGALGGLGGLGYGMYKNASTEDHVHNASGGGPVTPKQRALSALTLAGIAGLGANYLGAEDAAAHGNRNASMSALGALAPIGYGLGGGTIGGLLGAGIGRAIGAYQDGQVDNPKPIPLGSLLLDKPTALAVMYGDRGLGLGTLGGMGYGLYRAYSRPFETKTAMDKLSQKGFFASMGEGAMNVLRNRPRVPTKLLDDIAAASYNTMPFSTNEEDDAVSNYMEEVEMGSNPKSIMGVPTDSTERGTYSGLKKILMDPDVKGIPTPIDDKKQWLDEAGIAVGRNILHKYIGPHAINLPSINNKRIDVSRSFGPLANNPIVLNHEYYHARKDKPEISMWNRLLGMDDAKQKASDQEEHLADVYASTANNYDLWDVAKLYQDMFDEAPREPQAGDDHVDDKSRLQLFAAMASGTSPKRHAEMTATGPRPRDSFWARAGLEDQYEKKKLESLFPF